MDLLSIYRSSTTLILAKCYQPPPTSVGKCSVGIEGYYFNPSTGECEVYEIGACRIVPGQTFGSYETCVEACKYVRGSGPNYY